MSVVSSTASRDKTNEVHFSKLYELTERSGYEIIQVNGQRIYGPPPSLNIPKPPRGTEVFVGRLPRTVYEYDLVPLFERAGRIYKLRLMMDFSGRNRGYAFITYFTREAMQFAVELFHNYEIRKGCRIGVYKSVDNCRLFVGNVPLDKTKEDIWDTLGEVTEGITEIYMYKGQLGEWVNKGYVFVEFEDHKMAAMARRKLANGALLKWEMPLIVDWADPLPEVDPNVMARVKKLYIRNIPINLTNGQLWQILKKQLLPITINKVHKINDFAFVHFVSRKDAEAAMKILCGTCILGQPIEVSWARPRIYSKNNMEMRLSPNFCKSLPPRARRNLRNYELHEPSKSFHEPQQEPEASRPVLFNDLIFGNTSGNTSGFDLTNLLFNGFGTNELSRSK